MITKYRIEDVAEGLEGVLVCRERFARLQRDYMAKLFCIECKDLGPKRKRL